MAAKKRITPKVRPEMSQAFLKELLHYDPESGIFRWRITKVGFIKAGKITNSRKSSGYQRIKIGGIEYPAHRLAWLYVHGTLPPCGIDHKDTDTMNNCISNLRPATTAQNQQNHRKPNKVNRSGFLGVYLHKQKKKWCAEITVNKLKKHLGYFCTPEEAYVSYLAAKVKYHPFQTLV